MAEEGAPFLALVPAQERELPQPSQPANAVAAGLEEAVSEKDGAAPRKADAKTEAKTDAKTPAKTEDKSGVKTKRKAASKASGKTADKAADKRKRGKAVGARAAGPKSKGSSRTDKMDK
jgi:hypothetical protein